MATTKENALMRDIAKIIREEVKKHKYSQACVDCESTDKFFNDSCEYVALVAVMNDLATFLENGARYNEILNK